MSAKIIREMVHGDLSFNELELAIINTREFQRLRRIKQLGAVYLVYPSAEHSRFLHSLGTCAIAQQIISAIHAQTRRGENTTLARREQEIRLAALLHDILAVPFGHTLEDECRIISEDKKHDNIENLKEFLSSSDPFSIGSIVKKEDPALPSKIAKVITGADASFASDIVTNTVCADLFDYLARDTTLTGLVHRYDKQRIFPEFEIIKNRLVIRVADEKSGDIRHGLLSEIINLLRIRYTLAERVYYHPTKITASAMIARALALALKNRIVTLKELRALGDEELLYLLEHSTEKTKNEETEIIRRLIQKLRARELFRPVWKISNKLAVSTGRKSQFVRKFHEDPETRTKTEDQLAEKCGIPRGGVLIYCPRGGMNLKPFDALITWPGEEEGIKLREITDDVVALEIDELSRKHPDIWAMYVLIDPEHRYKKEQLRARCIEEFGPDDDYRSIMRVVKQYRETKQLIDEDKDLSVAFETAKRRKINKSPLSQEEQGKSEKKKPKSARKTIRKERKSHIPSPSEPQTELFKSKEES